MAATIMAISANCRFLIQVARWESVVERMSWEGTLSLDRDPSRFLWVPDFGTVAASDMPFAIKILSTEESNGEVKQAARLYFWDKMKSSHNLVV